MVQLEECMKVKTGVWYRDVHPPEGTDVYTYIHQYNGYATVSELVYLVNMGYHDKSDEKVKSKIEMDSWLDNRQPVIVKDTTVINIITKDAK